jgi:hypothetical protein
MAANDLNTGKPWDRYVYLLYAGDDPTWPFYVGVGKDGKDGMRRHLDHFRRVEKCNPAKNNFVAECKAAGVKFNWGIWPDLTRAQAYQMEIELIAHYGRRGLGTGCLFNISAGGVGGGRDALPSTREKMSAAALGNKYALGYRHTPEELAKMSGASRGEKNPNFGKRHTPEARDKIRAAALGNKLVRRPEMSFETCKKLAKATRRFYTARRYTPDQGELF